MLSETINRFQYLLETIPAKLLDIKDQDFSFKPSPDKWSKKEILGHLIDSACNNHQRFIRVQYENVPVLFYDQNKWNSLNHYGEIDKKQIINLWTIYNQHLLQLIRHIPNENLKMECNTGGKENVTLEWLIEDYVVHMEHHLKQVLNYQA